MTDPRELNHIPCEKIDPALADIYIKFGLCVDDATKLCLDTSWGKTCLDLLPAFSGAADMLGTLRLSPSLDPTELELDLGRKGNSYVSGDDLNRILHMTKLHDVDQTKDITDGDVLRYNGKTDLFEPFNLKQALTNLDALLAELERRVKALEEMDYELRIAEIRRRIRDIEEALNKLEEQDWGDIDYIDESGKLQTYVFKSYDDFVAAGRFNIFSSTTAGSFVFSDLTVAKTSLRRLRIGTSVVEIPGFYGAGAIGIGDWKFTLDPIPDSVKKINNDFFRLNLALSGGTTIPASVQFIGIGFLGQLGEFTGPLVVETSVLPSSYDSTDHNSAPLNGYGSHVTAYTTGITLTGSHAQEWKAAMPDSSTLYRKLKVQ